MVRVIVVGVLVVACAGGATPTTASPTTTSASATTTVQPPTTTTAPEATTTSATPTTVVAGLRWEFFVVPFTLPEPDFALRKTLHAGAEYVDFVGGENEWVVFTTSGPEAIDDLVDLFQGRGATVTEPSSVDLGGVEASYVDVVIGDESLSLHSAAQARFVATPGDSFRAYIVNVDGTVFKIYVLTYTEGIAEWVAKVEPLLVDITWG